MAPRRSRKEKPQTSSHGTQRKRARRDSPVGDSEESHHNTQSDQERSVPVMTGSTSQPSAISWPATVKAFEEEPLASQVQRYKDWRRSGSVNEKICRVCSQPGDLHPCHTCRPAFHAACIPQGSYHGSQNRLFCTLCVQRGWHVAAPALTPPASPSPEPVQQPDARVPSTSAMSIPSLITSALGSDVQSEALPIPPVQVPPANALPSIDSNHTTQGQVAVSGSLDLRNGGSPHENTTGLPNPSRSKRKRNSRFTTLSSDVDASLSILYRELESTASLKAQVEELQNRNLEFLQGIKIRDNNIAALRRDLQRRRSADEELERLKASAFSSDSLKQKVADLEAQNARLHAELQASREQTATAQELVNDWKGKLAQLLNTS